MSSKDSGQNGGATFKGFSILFLLGFLVILIGMTLIIAATILLGGQGSSWDVGGVIFIGPFPIVFGAGPEVHWLVFIAIILAILSIVMLILMRRYALRNL